MGCNIAIINLVEHASDGGKVMSPIQLLKMVLSRALGMVVVFMLFFFLPAGTWNYWQAWVYTDHG